MDRFVKFFTKVFNSNKDKRHKLNYSDRIKNRVLVKSLCRENDYLKSKLKFYINYYLENKEKWNLARNLLQTFSVHDNIDDFFSDVMRNILKFSNNEEIYLIIYSETGINKIFTPNTKSAFIALYQKYFEKIDYKNADKKLKEIFKWDYAISAICGKGIEYGYLFMKEPEKKIEDSSVFVKTICEYIALGIEQYENRLSLKFDNKNKVEFLVNFSHEIKTPLNGIITYSELLKNEKEKFSTDIKKYIKNINISARQLNYLMADITESAKTQYSQLKVHKEIFFTNIEILNILSVFHSKIIEKNLEIEQILTDVEINSDIAKFNQILYNLISNAIKFSPPSSKITLSSWVENARFHFEIKDEGCGIDEREKDKIFKFLSQGNSKNQKEGSGIGLAISKKIIEIQGGEIGYAGKPNEGTAFWFNLPLDGGL